MVHPEKQIWHCFGCGKGGDIFTFLQEMEGIDFPEALKILAERAGVKMDTYVSEINKSQKNRLLEINAKAAYFFHHFLLEMPTAHSAREYLDRRQLKKETIEEWQIGFIPEQWDLLTQYLLKKGFAIDDLIASGLTIKKDGANFQAGKGFYDRFRGRIMFPIWDAHGNNAGFTGRVLVETEKSGGKYVNTPQSPVFDKSRLLYGLNKAKMEIKTKDLTVLVEGQMDVVACHQAGMKNVVAASGTALTFEQVKLLKRYSNNIAMAFDADAAGQNAAKRGIDIALEQGMNIKIIKIPEGAGKDADECLKKNPAVWFKAVESATDVMEWYFNSAFSAKLESGPKQKQKIIEGLLPEIARLQFGAERDHWLRQLSEKLDIDANVLREELKKSAKQPQPSRQAGGEDQPKNVPIFNGQDQGYLLRLESLWSLLMKFPKLIISHYSYLRPEFFTGTPYMPLYELIKEAYNPNIVTKTEIREILEEGGDLVSILLLKADKDFEGFSKEDSTHEVDDLLEKIKSEWIKKRRKELNDHLKIAQTAKDEKKMSEILKEILTLQ